MSDSLGDRIKRYENVSRHFATQRMPLIIRVDGRAFHTFTKGLEKPFSPRLMEAMVDAAYTTASEMQGFKAAYVQSDEVTFCLTDYDTIDTQGWFGYNLSKIISISAATMSVEFNDAFGGGARAVFDSRAYSVPVDDVANVFLWRAKDWNRNSLQMYARKFLSHKQLHGVGAAAMHELLHLSGANWATDLTLQEKNGAFILNTHAGAMIRYDIEPTYDQISRAINPLLMERSRWKHPEEKDV